jgi:hypothetical protein
MPRRPCQFGHHVLHSCPFSGNRSRMRWFQALCGLFCAGRGWIA